jgi:parallel beta-helix repeat protein
LTVLFLSGINLVSEEVRAYTPHAPIYIWMDGGFTPANGVTAGTGTPSDPYIIEGWEIDASAGEGIYVNQNTVHFIIRNVYIHSGGVLNGGLYFTDVKNGRVENCISTGNAYGVRIFRSDVTVENCEITSNKDEGVLFESRGGAVLNSEIHSNIGHGIRFEYSENSVAIGNNISGNSDGMRLMQAINITIMNNNIYSNPYEGVKLWGASDVDLIGNNIYSNGWMGIHFQGSSQVRVENNHVYQNDYTGINAFGPQYISISDNLLESNGRHGLHIASTNHIEAVGNTVISNDKHGINLESAFDNVVLDNVISNNGDFGMQLKNSGDLDIFGNEFQNDDIVIVGTQISHFNQHTIPVNNTVNDLPVYYHKDVDDLVVDGIPMGELLVVNCTNLEARNLSLSDADVGIELAFVDDGVASGNVISGMEHMGIYAYSVNGVTIADNDVSNGGDGMSVYQSADTTLTGNRIQNNDAIGIYVSSSVGAVIADNYVVDNGLGIHASSSIDTDIDHNYVSGGDFGVRTTWASFLNVTRNVLTNFKFGIHMYETSTAEVHGNEIIENANGTYLTVTATGIRFHANNFIDNGEQAWDDNMTKNFWNESYPTGGNYWSDYTGIDSRHGPNQDLSGGDGLGDHPHYLAGVGLRNDTYPLMDQVQYPIMPPSAPQNVTTSPGNGEVTLAWTSPSFTDGFQVDNYIIYRGDSPGSASFLVELGDVLTYTDTGLTNGQAYYYQVSARTLGGEGERSLEVNETPAKVPGAPAITDLQVSDGQVVFNWTAPSDDGGAPILKYTVYRGPSSGQLTFHSSVGNVSGYADLGLTNGVPYHYVVAAVNKAGQGPNSTEVNATPENLAPICTIVVPEPGAALSGTILFWGNVSDPDGTVETVEMKFDDGTWFSVTLTTRWEHTVVTRIFRDGEHTAYIRAWDGDKYSLEGSVAFTVDNVADEEPMFEGIWLWLLIIVVIVVTIIAVLLVKRRGKAIPEEEIVPSEPAEEEVEEVSPGPEREES